MDLESELLEAVNEAVGDLRAVTTIEVVGTQIVVLHAVAEHLVGGGEHGGGHGEDGFPRASPALEAEELSAQKAVAGAGTWRFR